MFASRPMERGLRGRLPGLSGRPRCPRCLQPARLAAGASVCSALHSISSGAAGGPAPKSSSTQESFKKSFSQWEFLWEQKQTHLTYY